MLTAGMVDRRLRQLDQDVEIDYWRVGLRGTGGSVGAAGATMTVRVGSGEGVGVGDGGPEVPPKVRECACWRDEDVPVADIKTCATGQCLKPACDVAVSGQYATRRLLPLNRIESGGRY